MELMKHYFDDFRVLLGYGGSAGFFWMEHHEKYGGMILTAFMILSSIILQWEKVKSIRNEERRREERHRQELLQDQEKHLRNLQNKEHGNAE